MSLRIQIMKYAREQIQIFFSFYMYIRTDENL